MEVFIFLLQNLMCSTIGISWYEYKIQHNSKSFQNTENSVQLPTVYSIDSRLLHRERHPLGDQRLDLQPFLDLTVWYS